MRRKPSSRPVVLCLVVAALFIALPVAAEETAQTAPRQSVVVGSGEGQSVAAASRCQKCGDGYCARSCENEFTCPTDCAPKTAAARCGKCGDGRCVPQCGETATSCPADCGATESVAANDDAPACGSSTEAASTQAKPDSKRD